MALILEVISYKGAPPISPLIARFDESGGSIGRSFDNHLALPDEDKIISRHHGDIRYENGVYVYRDTSTGGTLLCNENRLLENGVSVTLADGDHLKVGEFELGVRIESEAQPFPGLFSGLGDSQAVGSQGAEPMFDLSIPPLFNDREPSPVLDRDVSPPHPVVNASFINQPDAPPFQENFTPPGIQPIPEDFSFDDMLRDETVLPHAAPPKTDGLEFPDNWFGDLGFEQVAIGEPSTPAPEPPLPSIPMPVAKEDFFPEPVLGVAAGDGKPNLVDAFEPFAEPPTPVIDMPQPGRSIPPSKVAAAISAPAEPSPPIATPQTPSPAPATARSIDVFQCFLRGAGLAEFPKMTEEEQGEAMKALGEVYRDMVDGMMMVLRARTEEKREIRTDITVIRKEKNNPLKFIPTVEDAMKVMISRKYSGYIDATVAVREGFADIMKHQMAMRAGMQASVGESLKRFEPTDFEKRFEEGIVFQKKAKCWDAYAKAYPRLVVEAMDNLFGDTFAKAYEEQMRMLRDACDKS